MPIFIQLIKWTDQGRANVKTIPDRVDTVVKQLDAMGVKVLGNYVTMGRFDQVAIAEAPDDETVAKVAVLIAGRGNAYTETLRGFTMDEVRKIIS